MIAAAKIRVVPKTADAAARPGALEHLSDLKGFMIADSTPDPRGWEVEVPDRGIVGTVEDLLVDTADLSVRYIEVKVYHDVLGTDDDESLLIPVQRAQIDEGEQLLNIDRLPDAGLAAAPRSPQGAPTKSQEQQIHDYYGVDIMGELIQNELPPTPQPPII